MVLNSKSENHRFDKILGALVLGGAADALGWPNESAPSGRTNRPTLRNFIKWNKRIGRVGGYWDWIEPGEYSDDTQLTLAVARCITEDGEYDARRFANVELPYWLKYQRGGGRTVKAAAKNLETNPSLSWNDNFFERYKQSGANGVAMRVLALATIQDIRKMTLATWKNAVASHGHPRAIVGGLVMAFSLYHLLSTRNFSPREYASELGTFIRSLHTTFEDEDLNNWVLAAGANTFRDVFSETQAEMIELLRIVWKNLSQKKEKVMEKLGCYNPKTRGSGTATVAAGNYYLLKYYDQPIEGIIEAANAVGTDTDTIGKFLGNLLGMLHGKAAYETEFSDTVQDRFYFYTIAEHLSGLNRVSSRVPPGTETEITEDAREGDGYFSKVFGPGVITTARKPRKVWRGKALLYQARVQFDCGQSCMFSQFRNGLRQKRNGLGRGVTTLPFTPTL